MKYRRVLATFLSAILLGVFGIAVSAPAQASITCFGSTGCGGKSPTVNDCVGSEEVAEEITVQNLGQLVLYKSDICATAWAQLTIGTGVSAFTGAAEGYQYIAEIFYEGPEGGPEQFQVTTPWNGTGAQDVLTTNMVPDTASFKACAGSPSGSADPFDEDPQGTLGSTLTMPQPPSYYDAGACTMWH